MSRVFSEIHRQRLRESSARRWARPEEHKALTAEHKQILLASNTGRIQPAEQRRHISEAAISRGAGYRDFCGGAVGDYYATILCPLGYIREHRIQWGLACGEFFRLDFALVCEKIAIELDGPLHGITWIPPVSDAERDARLHSLGWKVIRISHD